MSGKKAVLPLGPPSSYQYTYVEFDGFTEQWISRASDLQRPER